MQDYAQLKTWAELQIAVLRQDPDNYNPNDMHPIPKGRLMDVFTTLVELIKTVDTLTTALEAKPQSVFVDNIHARADMLSINEIKPGSIVRVQGVENIPDGEYKIGPKNAKTTPKKRGRKKAVPNQENNVG